MAQSLSKLYVHIVFHIGEKRTFIRQEDENNLYSYLGGILKQNDSIPIQINGIHDHVHILCVLSKNIALANLVQKVKSSSSGWIKKQDSHYRNFAWQRGYAAFSVSASLHDKTVRYIFLQKEHHRKKGFREELVRFLKEYDVEYDEKYLWIDD